MYEIKIDPERLKHFPKTAPMNIREAVLVLAEAMKRIRKIKAAQKSAPTNEEVQKEASPEPAPAPAPAVPAPAQEDKVPAPTKRRKPRAEIIIKKSHSPKKVVS